MLGIHCSQACYHHFKSRKANQFLMTTSTAAMEQ